MRYIFLTILCIFSQITVCIAGQTNNRSKMENAWGIVTPGWTTCFRHDVGSTHPCVGNTKNCASGMAYKNPNYGDEAGYIVFIPTTSYDHGGYFCPVSLIGRNKNKGDSWTTYDAVAGNNTVCFTLCAKGYTGPKCENNYSAVSSCNKREVTQSSFDHLQMVRNGYWDVEGSVGMFAANNYAGCGVNKGQEHDIVLMISDWTSSGKGAFVRPYYVRAQRSGWKDMDSWINLQPAGGQVILGCLNGYKQNADNTDCVPINEDICNSLGWCSGWTESAYQQKISERVIYVHDLDKCMQSRCKDPTKAFDKDWNCTVDCIKDSRNGVSPDDGTCITCQDGYVFDKDSRQTGFCKKALTLDKTFMQYGTGGQNAEYDSQCWTMTDFDNYKSCVLGKPIEKRDSTDSATE